MDSSSVGMLVHVFTFFFFLFLISSVYAADDSPALPSPDNCFQIPSGTNSCGFVEKYPLYSSYGSDGCGYPGLEVRCDRTLYGGRGFINISNHIYIVGDFDYENQQLRLVDAEVEGQECPQPKRNYSLQSSDSFVEYSQMWNSNISIFYNCSSVPGDAEENLLCSQNFYTTTHTPPSYAFYQTSMVADRVPDWYYRNCAENVVVPVLSYVMGEFSNTIKYGFYLNWSATGWCKDCEGSGGQCWSSYYNSSTTGCACKHSHSYNNRTCPPPPPPPAPAPAPQLRHRQPPPPFPHPRGMTKGLKIGAGVLAGIGGLLLVVLLVFCRGVNHSSFRVSYLRKKNKSPINVEVFLERYGCLALQRYKYSDIRLMTKSFKDALGQGGYGHVFKGELRDGRLVAVKILNEPKGDGEDFINEVATIGRTNHVNVVNLVGFCIEGTRRALVYEFMPNGSPERFIYTQKESLTPLPLGWEKLYQIALGVARGLEYLHRGCNTRILHFDIKPHNILLDEIFCPKISDFGLAKLYPARESIVSTVGARGTMGYIAPELCFRTFGNVSHKLDVYSYGMMMLEMIGGRKNIDPTVDNLSEIYFPLWIHNHLKRNNDAEGLEEMQAAEMFKDEKAKKMIMVTLWCIQAHPIDRPSMTKVVEMLEGNTQELQMPPNPSVDPRSNSSASS